MNTKTMKTSWIKTMAATFAASAITMGAQGAEVIAVDEVTNHYPWDGKVDCVTTLSGLDTTGDYEYKGVFTLSVKKDGTKLSQIVTNDLESADGTYTNTFDCTTLFGAGVYLNGGIAVKLVKKEVEKQLGGVQLWADGPYWAECNVGATKAEEYGYYFMWGDTVGYTNTGSAWISVNDGTTLSGFKYSNCATWEKNNATLLSGGYIDSTGNLVAAHDAATAYWGDQWRMPTYAEMQALVDNCTTEWTTVNGVYGRLVKGKDDYASKSIFIPAAGDGYQSVCRHAGSYGYCWSSTPFSNAYTSNDARALLNGNSGCSCSDIYYRYQGFSVRPVRVVAK